MKTRLAATALVLLLAGCTGSEASNVVLGGDGPIHLEQHLDAATVVGSEVPADAPASTVWRFDEPQEDWRATVPWNPTVDPVEVRQLDDALRVTLTEGTMDRTRGPFGGLVLDVPGLDHEDLAYLLVRARTTDDVRFGIVGFNRRPGTSTDTDIAAWPFENIGDRVPIVSDGTVQTYRIRLDYFAGRPPPTEPVRQIGLWFRSDDPASIDILSLELVPKVAEYADAGAESRVETRGRIYRQTIATNAPSRIEYRVRVPEGGRLDFGMGVLREDAPVSFRVMVDPDGSGGDEPVAVFEEAYAEKEGWGQRSVDLASLAGRTVTLGLETTADDSPQLALWGAPTVTGSAPPGLPNVIFYVFDGGAADFMSVYGYNRRTTPTLERLAEEGVVFEHAYSNSSWTLPSTASFMTSLQTSVTGGLTAGANPVPAEAVTMAEHMHRAGYETSVFTGNPNAGTLSGLQRGVDVFREDWEDFSYFTGNNHRESSRFLHEGFWEWREAYPGQPFWAHFQTTDTHFDFPTVPPFAGRFVSPTERETWLEWDQRMREARARVGGREAFDEAGIERSDYFGIVQGLYDEAMAHNDYQLGRLIDRLKAEGEWENTLLIIGSDHSIWAAVGDMAIQRLDSLPPSTRRPLLRPTITRVPLMFVWPGRISGGQRFDQPVSMIDVLPTLLDLVGLPPAEIAQGQSLAPLMLGQDGWEPRPVILDEFEVDEDGELSGRIEVIDGRWGASLEVGSNPGEDGSETPPLLLYDLWNEPMAITSVHVEHPELVEKYTALLEDQFQAHLDLSQFFTRSGDVELTAEQLETLRSLGYIR